MSDTLYAPSKFVYSAPIPSASPLAIGSPRRNRHTLGPIYQFSSSKDKKEAVFRDVSTSCYIVPKEMFFESIIPQLKPGFDVKSTVKQLEKKKCIQDSRFTHFPIDPSQEVRSENEVFKALENLVADIIATVHPDDFPPTMKFRCNPDAVPMSYDRDSSTRPDCSLSEADAELFEWIKLSVAIELKLKNTEAARDDNVLKEIWSLHHCMSEDARRRFAVGITIEDTQLRIWFANREKVLVSVPFNFLTDVHSTCHLFLSLMFAEDWELGWDTNMERVANNQFNMKIADSVWRTVERLSDVGADCLLGRGTRVWRARQLIDDEESGPFVVIKDFWIEDTRQREGNIYKLLHAAGVGPFLLNVIADEDVYVEPAGFVDHTETLATRSAAIPERSEPLDLVQAFSKLQPVNPSPGVYLFPEIPPPCLVKNNPRVHYRLILDKQCTPLHEWTCLSDILLAMSQACSAIHQMHTKGWVHRDITPSNILVSKKDGRVITYIADLEYAKSLTEKTEHAGRSGSGIFTAVEVDFCFYKFMLPRNNEPEVYQEPVDDYENPKGRKDTPLTEAPALFGHFPFQYNVLHDLESLLWVIRYILASREAFIGGHPGGVSTEQRLMSWNLFFRADSLTSRHDLLTSDLAAAKFIESLHPSTRVVAQHLDLVRIELVKAYLEVEKDPTNIDNTVGDHLVVFFKDRLERAARQLQQRQEEVSVRVTFSRRLEEFAEFFSLRDPTRAAQAAAQGQAAPQGQPAAQDGTQPGATANAPIPNATTNENAAPTVAITSAVSKKRKASGTLAVRKKMKAVLHRLVGRKP